MTVKHPEGERSVCFNVNNVSFLAECSNRVQLSLNEKICSTWALQDNAKLLPAVLFHKHAVLSKEADKPGLKIQQ